MKIFKKFIVSFIVKIYGRMLIGGDDKNIEMYFQNSAIQNCAVTCTYTRVFYV